MKSLLLQLAAHCIGDPLIATGQVVRLTGTGIKAAGAAIETGGAVVELKGRQVKAGFVNKAEEAYTLEQINAHSAAVAARTAAIEKLELQIQIERTKLNMEMERATPQQVQQMQQQQQQFMEATLVPA